VSPTSEPAHDAKRIRRETAREARRQELRRVERRRRTRNLAIVGGLAAGVLAIVGWLVWPAFRSGPSGTVPQGAQVAGQGARAADLGERIDDQGRDHIALGSAHPAYNSNPPTSGWHTPQVANWGSFRTELPDELVLHNLEHGGVWISYKDPGDGTLVEQLEALASRYRSKVIVNFVIVFPDQDSWTCARMPPGPSMKLKRTRFDERDVRSKKFGMPVIPSHASNPWTISFVAPDRTSEGAFDTST